jgi:hypothetical protein
MFAKGFIAIGVLAPTLGLALGAAPSRSDELADITTSIETVDTARGCRITVKAKNGGSRGDIYLRSEDSRVRAKIRALGVNLKWGTWKKPLPMSNRRIKPGELVTMTMELSLNCNVRRQYEFVFKKGSNKAFRCYGGSKGTTIRDIALSDVNRLFTYASKGC